MTTAVFSQRTRCLGCGSQDLEIVSQGRFDEGRLPEYIAADPWGENPSPYLSGKSWVLVRCSHCRLRFHQYILSPEWNEIRFSRWMSSAAIHEFEMRHGRADRFERSAYFLKHVLALRSLLVRDSANLPIKVLDFGSGNGEFLSVCNAFGFEAHGVDRSDARRSISSHVRVHESLAAASSCGPFDVVTLFEVLEHVDEPRSLLVDLRNVLRSGGLLIVETPDCEGISSMEKEDHYRAIHPLDHINVFEAATLREFVERAGFIQIRKPVVFATANVVAALKSIIRWIIRRPEGVGTQQYFRKE
jgi:SAM-dependent methyltransferase